MRKIYTLLLVAAFTAQAQIPNHGFEERRDNGMSLKNWGAYYPIPDAIDPLTGQSTSDQIFFDFGTDFSFGVADCWTGESAMYLSNAFNATKNEVIPGFSRLFNDEESESANGLNYGKAIPEGTLIQIFGFDYKFSPLGNDIALAWIEVFDVQYSDITIS